MLCFWKKLKYITLFYRFIVRKIVEKVREEEKGLNGLWMKKGKIPLIVITLSSPIINAPSRVPVNHFPRSHQSLWALLFSNLMLIWGQLVFHELLPTTCIHGQKS